MKLDPQVLECLEWECRNGIRTAASIKLLQEQAERAPAATMVTLQESQEPTSYKKDNGPLRFDEPILRQPAVPATEGHTKTLSEISEVELIEARNQLYSAATAGGPLAKLPADIHARLFHAIVG